MSEAISNIELQGDAEGIEEQARNILGMLKGFQYVWADQDGSIRGCNSPEDDPATNMPRPLVPLENEEAALQFVKDVLIVKERISKNGSDVGDK